ncbi:hypothetical protein NX059_010574 [Plenodomus lindquistii]|nr:hypothetical protein NX059_010574 [Plenodomus lindquistii]
MSDHKSNLRNAADTRNSNGNGQLSNQNNAVSSQSGHIIAGSPQRQPNLPSGNMIAGSLSDLRNPSPSQQRAKAAAGPYAASPNSMAMGPLQGYQGVNTDQNLRSGSSDHTGSPNSTHKRGVSGNMQYDYTPMGSRRTPPRAYSGSNHGHAGHAAQSPSPFSGSAYSRGTWVGLASQNLDYSGAQPPSNSHRESLHQPPGRSMIPGFATQDMLIRRHVGIDPSRRTTVPSTQNGRDVGQQMSNLPHNIMDLHRQVPASSDPFSDRSTPTSFNPEVAMRELFKQPGNRDAMPSSQVIPVLDLIAPASTYSTQSTGESSQSTQRLRSLSTSQAPKMSPYVSPLDGMVRPASPTALNRLHFKSRAEVRGYLQRPTWHTVFGMWAVPRTEAENAFYVRKLVEAICNIDEVWDAEGCPWSLLKFQPGGECTDPVYVESIAWVVVIHAGRIHMDGVTGPQFAFAPHFKSQYGMDQRASFPQRIEFLAQLFRHSKMAASEVMTRQYVDKYVALPFTHLMKFQEFKDYWNGLAEDERKHQLGVVPYPPFARQYDEHEAMQMITTFKEKHHLHKPHTAQAPKPDGGRNQSLPEAPGSLRMFPVDVQSASGSRAWTGHAEPGGSASTPRPLEAGLFMSQPSSWGPGVDILSGLSDFGGIPPGQNNLSAGIAELPVSGANMLEGQGYMGDNSQVGDQQSLGLTVAAQPGDVQFSSSTNGEDSQSHPEKIDVDSAKDDTGDLFDIGGAST